MITFPFQYTDCFSVYQIGKGGKHCDDEEHGAQTLNRQDLQQKLEHATQRVEELLALKEIVLRDGSVYDTDPDARMMKNSSSGVDICHNVQIAVESENHLVVAVDVTSQAIDREQLAPISCQAKENLGVPKLTVVADRGYYSGKQFAKCVESGIVPIVSKPIATRAGISAQYGKEAFRYDELLGGYICPEGNLLTAYRSRPGSKYKDYTRYANEKACAECPARNQCSDGKHGRTICDQPYEADSREVDQRTKANMDIYRKRQQLVEHPFGTVKRALGFTYFLTVGTENVRTESILHFLAYNLRRVINMLKMRKMAQGTQG